MNSNDFKNIETRGVYIYIEYATDIEFFELCFDQCLFEKLNQEVRYAVFKRLFL